MSLELCQRMFYLDRPKGGIFPTQAKDGLMFLFADSGLRNLPASLVILAFSPSAHEWDAASHDSLATLPDIPSAPPPLRAP
ncbi:hypothetical protein EMIT0196P_20518 [Pseudomonas chlororaphis]|nr:hypothetical protein C4K15_3150 [Pseudomonas chlororaphis subsp. aurantiaca]